MSTPFVSNSLVQPPNCPAFRMFPRLPSVSKAWNPVRVPPRARHTPEALADDARVAATPVEADMAIVRLDAPYEPRNELFLEAMFHAGSLEFDAVTVARIEELAAQVPVVLVVNLDRPAILTPLEPHCSAILATFGVSDEALVRVLTGAVNPEGRLPFDLPRSIEAVLESQSDVPGGTLDPLYAYGDGLRRLDAPLTDSC
ncbi:glycoside hydrolase family 3 C-terminal domain-containing protein [Paenarthrobacter sp. NPDC091711]|uniref:glycoside hydrolase family 3 C-terminal domain-containing protein n=1 Tax=Paenarthrobacter sp. NPDC091711 TaxID=3364385 RepID=UPI0037FA1B18